MNISLNFQKNILIILSLINVLFFCNFARAVPDSFADLVENLVPSVVSIASTTIVENRNQAMPRFPEGSPFDDFFKEYYENEKNSPSQRPMTGLGSGFIIDKSGIIVTNNHVIEGADEIAVILHNQKKFKAELLGRDPKADLAVLKIDPARPPDAYYADKAKAQDREAAGKPGVFSKKRKGPSAKKIIRTE